MTLFTQSRYLFTLPFIILLFSCTNQPKPVVSSEPIAKIFLNQVGYDIQAPKRALIALPVDETASRFIVYDGSSVVLQGNLAPTDIFTEWGQGIKYYSADFSSIHRPGKFKIVVNRKKTQLISSDFIIKTNAYFELTVESVLSYFKTLRQSGPTDKSIRLNGTENYHDVFGGWYNSPTDSGKSLSVKNDSNLFISQQGAMPIWALAKSFSHLNTIYDHKGLTLELAEEVVWGADYLRRSLSSDGYFYGNVLDKLGDAEQEIPDERLITGFDQQSAHFNTHYQAAFREGAGMAIAALARAYEISQTTGVEGEYSAKQYLLAAETAFIHTQANNLYYVDNGQENIIDDYTALIAATDLYRVTKKYRYLEAAKIRAHNLNNRLTSQGWFISDSDDRPFYHDTDAGMPIIALLNYLTIEKDRLISSKTKRTIKSSINYQLSLNTVVSNPFNLARQTFQTHKAGNSSELREGFFMPHRDDKNYAWQGESARLASLSAAVIMGGKVTHRDPQGPFGVDNKLASFSQSQMDWILGKNPYQISMLNGYGVKNPDNLGNTLVIGGVSNGITGATLSPDGRGITWAPSSGNNNSRWVAQPIQNSAWYLLAITAMTQ